jgi:glycosyltransferase involved in cell wall biosynthesis
MTKIKLIRLTTIPLTLKLLLKNQLRYLSNHFEVIAVSSPGADLNIVKEREGVKIEPIEINREISLFKDFKSLLQLILFFKKEKPEIVHSNTPKASLLSMFAGWITGVNIRIYTIGGLRFEGSQGIKRAILILMEHVSCFFATHVLCESLGVKEKILAAGVNEDKLIILKPSNLNGVDTSYFDPNNYVAADIRKEFGIYNDDFVFLFVGRIVKDKGVKELLDAFELLIKNFKSIKLFIVGPNDGDSEFYDIKKSRIERINGIEYLDQLDDVRKILVASNCLVLPSYREGFPNVVLEAGSMGKPVIMTNVNGHLEYLNKSNGLLVEIGNVKELYLAMQNIFLNRDNYSSNEIRKFVIENFECENVRNSLLKFYYDALDGIEK